MESMQCGGPKLINFRSGRNSELIQIQILPSLKKSLIKKIPVLFVELLDLDPEGYFGSSKRKIHKTSLQSNSFERSIYLAPLQRTADWRTGSQRSTGRME